MRTEAIIPPLKEVVIRPMDNNKPHIIYVGVTSSQGTEVTPYICTENLSFDTICRMRAELGLPIPKNDDDLRAELNAVLAGNL